MQSPQHPQRRPTAGSSALCRDDLSASWIRPADRSLCFCADSAASLFTLGTGSGLLGLWLGLSHTGFPSKIRSGTHLRSPSVRPRRPQGFPCPPTARPSLSSPLQFLVQREVPAFPCSLPPPSSYHSAPKNQDKSILPSLKDFPNEQLAPSPFSPQFQAQATGSWSLSVHMLFPPSECPSLASRVALFWSFLTYLDTTQYHLWGPTAFRYPLR